MPILVAYASKYGATQGIAVRIAQKLRAAGQEVEVRPAKAAGDLASYEAFVIGGAAYYGHWMKEVTELVRANQTLLVDRPVWLFSSGPLGTKATDAQGRDVRVAAEPKEMAELREAIKPRGYRVFFGAFQRGRLRLVDRLVAMMPAGRELLPEGDFRDWKDVETWAERVAEDLASAG